MRQRVGEKRLYMPTRRTNVCPRTDHGRSRAEQYTVQSRLVWPVKIGSCGTLPYLA
jgi:hypothetical protein